MGKLKYSSFQSFQNSHDEKKSWFRLYFNLIVMMMDNCFDLLFTMFWTTE